MSKAKTNKSKMKMKIKNQQTKAGPQEHDDIKTRIRLTK